MGDNHTRAAGCHVGAIGHGDHVRRRAACGEVKHEVVRIRAAGDGQPGAGRRQGQGADRAVAQIDAAGAVQGDGAVDGAGAAEASRVGDRHGIRSKRGAIDSQQAVVDGGRAVVGVDAVEVPGAPVVLVDGQENGRASRVQGLVRADRPGDAAGAEAPEGERFVRDFDQPGERRNREVAVADDAFTFRKGGCAQREAAADGAVDDEVLITPGGCGGTEGQ